MESYIPLFILGTLSVCAAAQFAAAPNTTLGIKFTLFSIWFCFFFGLVLGVFSQVTVSAPAFGFQMDPVSYLMTLLVLFISGIVHLFSLRYMAGDRMFYPYFLKLTLLTASTAGFVLADNIVLTLLFWCLNQFLLASLMVHKAEWSAAKEGGRLYTKYAFYGSMSLALGLGILGIQSGSFSLTEINAKVPDISSYYLWSSFLLIGLAACIQSGIWPMHRWLISSLNSPTPVSAFMHAGLVNGGGLLLVKLAPLALSHEAFLNILVVLGVVTVILGTLWKFMQNNIKKMLACSTVAQMGFMFLQCGLGLFPAAVAHICWHGLFKAFLFLNSGSAFESKIRSDKQLSILSYIASFIAAVAGATLFSWTARLSLNVPDTQWVLVFFAAISIFHISLAAFRSGGEFAFASCAIASIAFGSIYGASLYLIESLLAPMQLWNPQPLGMVHIAAMAAVFVVTVVINYMPVDWQENRLWQKTYVKLMNMSQSSKNTLTAIRKDYKF